MKEVRAFQVDEIGSADQGFVAFGFLGLCAWGPNRQAAWDVLCSYIRAAKAEVKG